MPHEDEDGASATEQASDHGVETTAGEERPKDGAPRRSRLAAALRLLLSLSINFALVFLPAGTWRWPEGWIFLGTLLAFSLAVYLMLRREDPELLAERRGSPFRKGQKGWDKVWYAFFLLVVLLWLPLAGIDAVRYGWSRVPTWLELAGGLVYALSFWLLLFVFRANTFLSPVVRIQSERGHALVDTGPYAIVRHPMYACMTPLMLGASLMLGSLAAMGAACVLVLLLCARIVLEERTLRAELRGYAEYATRVRWRLIPGVW